jgi:anion-transporting  ArsA/GET3 family ATPase
VTVLDKRLVFVTGKGGVGKTAVAAALGLVAAGQGRRTIVAEVARRDDVARALAGEPGAFEEVPLAPGLHAISVDPQSAMEEYLADQLARPLADLLATSRLFAYFAAATPGMRELLTMGKLWELAQPERRTPGAEPYDLVIVDAPATGHGLALLDAPRTFADVAAAGPIARQARIIHGTLSDRAQTGVVVVATPQEAPVTEALELRDRLGARVDLVVANAVRADRFTDADAGVLRDRGGHPAAAAALADHARAREQAAQLARLGARAALPFAPDDATAGADLPALAAVLEDVLAAGAAR